MNALIEIKLNFKVNFIKITGFFWKSCLRQKRCFQLEQQILIEEKMIKNRVFYSNIMKGWLPPPELMETAIN